MANFIGMVYGTLKSKGIDTSKMSTEEAIAKFNEIGGQKEQNSNLDEKIAQLDEKIKKTTSIIEKIKLLDEINMLREGYSSVEEYKQAQEKQRLEAQEKLQKQRAKQQEQQTTLKNLTEEPKKIKNKELKEKQLTIIEKYNPMKDEYHTGIRNIYDIKTFDETLDDEESFVWGDFSREDAEKAIKENSITIYSSYPISQGTFVSTSKRQAEEYAGGIGKKVYSKKIPLTHVAWISGDEGQYAEI